MYQLVEKRENRMYIVRQGKKKYLMNLVACNIGIESTKRYVEELLVRTLDLWVSNAAINLFPR